MQKNNGESLSNNFRYKAEALSPMIGSRIGLQLVLIRAFCSILSLDKEPVVGLVAMAWPQGYGGLKCPVDEAREIL